MTLVSSAPQKGQRTSDPLRSGLRTGRHRQETAGGAPDPGKIRPFTLTMPDNGYWGLGRRIGTAWSAGKDFGTR